MADGRNRSDDSAVISRGIAAVVPVEGLPVPVEFYLIIFLMVAMLVYAYFYSVKAGERAQRRRAAAEQTKTDTTEAA